MPELIVRVRDISHRHVGRPDPTDVLVNVDESHTVAELAAALAAPHDHRGEPVLASTRTGEVFDPATPVGRLDVLTGDELVVGTDAGAVLAAARVRRRDIGTMPPLAASSDASALMWVDVIAGPDTGRSLLVRRPGRYTVGRAHDATVRIADPSVSRRHVTIELDRDGGVTVHPVAATANGVLVNGTEVGAPTNVTATDVVTLGGTRLAIRPSVPTTERPPRRFGQVDFQRTPYRPTVIATRPTDPVGPIPDRPEPRRLPTIAVVAPLAAGLLMYAVTRQLQFLALTLLSPVVMVGSAVEDRRSGRRSTRERVKRFRCELAERRARFEQLRDAERVDRFRASPDVADLIRRAGHRTVDLWARGRAAPDFLVLRLGLGPATVGFGIELERGGADDLRDEALAALRGLDTLVDVPVTVELDGMLAIHGESALVDGVAASLTVQAATLHSPEDLVICAALAPGRTLEWLRWLPHARSVTSPLPGDHVATTADEADRLVERLIDVGERRAPPGDARRERTTIWPRVLVVLDADLDLDPARVARLLDPAPAAGLAVVWLAATAAEVPRQAARTLHVRRGSASMRGRLWSTDPDVADVELEVEHLRPERADRAARTLAPVRDASTVSLATTIPRSAPLLDVLGVGRPTASWVVEHWAHAPPAGLRFPVGLGADGPLELDLAEDGPHALVGGTSGAGKSELLQSMVAALAVHHPPDRLNFLFIDYKGGAGTQVFACLPHTVGQVTNLSADLAARALTSLRAELQRRMALLEGRAKDLTELLALAPDDAPPSLVIVVDEFATLVREIPEFVTGIVDIAQRGRSLGIHLVLATQRPTGSVNENILANTNLRISLRMLDRSESTAVVGVPDAADIPVPLRGRGLVRLGPRRLVEFQCAYGGAPLLAAAIRPAVRVRPFDSTDGTPLDVDLGGYRGGTQLDAVLTAIGDADRRLRLPAPRRPWCDVLPEAIRLDQISLDAGGPADGDAAAGCERAVRFVVIGVLDAPERQEQRAAVLDLAEGATVAYGSGGAGTSTLLRTIAASMVATAADGGDDVVIVAFDAGGRGCAGLAAIPGVEVVPIDDLEAVTRHLLVLERELDRRRARIAADGPAPEPRIVVLVDDLGAFVGALRDTSPAGDGWVERLLRLVVDGRHVGIHAVMTADRRGAVPTRLHSAVANRIVLRHADDSAYADHGIPAARRHGLVPGRGLWTSPDRAEPVLVQIATVSDDPAARSQTTALADLGDRLASRAVRPRPDLLRSRPLPDHDTSRLAVDDAGLVVAVGRADITGEIATVDLEWSHLAVSGPPRSGRSTVLATVAMQLADRPAPSGRAVVVAGPASSPLRLLPPHPGIRPAFGVDVGPLLDRLADAAVDPGGEPWVLVLDDLDALDDPRLVPAFERLARDESVRLVAAMEPRTGFTTNPLVTVARRARRHLVLQPDDPAEFLQLTGTRLAIRPGLRMPPGRGVLLVDRVATVVQVTDSPARELPAPSERRCPAAVPAGAAG